MRDSGIFTTFIMICLERERFDREIESFRLTVSTSPDVVCFTPLACWPAALQRQPIAASFSSSSMTSSLTVSFSGYLNFEYHHTLRILLWRHKAVVKVCTPFLHRPRRYANYLHSYFTSFTICVDCSVFYCSLRFICLIVRGQPVSTR